MSSPSRPELFGARGGLSVLALLGLAAAVWSGGPARAADSAGYRLAPRAFRAAAATVMPSVVTIETFGGLTNPGVSGRAGAPGPGGRPRPGGRPAPGGRGGVGGIGRPGEGPTTGLIVSADGYIITSTFNFIREQPIITVVLADGTQRVAKLMGRDETRKLCLLKIDNVRDLPVPRFVDPADLKIGQWAISVGVGYGASDPAISIGIVSAKNRVSGRAIQTDANISPANYGGPLIDIEGRVIGVCVPLSPRAQGVGGGVEWYDSGIGFCVPLHGMERILEELKAGKTIQPGRMGIVPGPAPAGAKGVAVASVQPKSAAEKAGLKKGDLIVAVDGAAINDAADLRTALGKRVAGDEITVTFRRDGKEETVKLKLDGGQDETPAPNPFRIPPPSTQPAGTQPHGRGVIPLPEPEPDNGGGGDDDN